MSTGTQLEAGRDLDVLVLEKVFDFPRRKVFTPDWGDEPYFIPSGKSKRTHMIDARPVPRFSESIAAAWEVVQRMRTEGWGFVTGDERPDADGWAAAFGHIHAGTIDARGETAPLAICRAALLALTPGGDDAAPTEENDVR